MVNYYLPRVAKITEPPRKLKDITFNWSNSHTAATDVINQLDKTIQVRHTEAH